MLRISRDEIIQKNTKTVRLITQIRKNTHVIFHGVDDRARSGEINHEDMNNDDDGEGSGKKKIWRKKIQHCRGAECE